MADQLPLSVAIIAHNEAANLGRCLPALQFADEIIVVDSDSTDQTVAVASQHGARVTNHPWEGFVAQRNFSIAQTTGRWILIIDADEIVSPALAAEIKAAITSDAADGYYLARRNHIAQRPINHGGWYPDWQLRLVRREFAHYENKAVHEAISPMERVGYLTNDLIHYTYVSLEEWISKTNRYTELEVPKKPFSLARLFWKPPATFGRSYILWSGWRDGTLGLIASAMGAWYSFLVEAKRWEKRPPKN